MKNSEKFLTAKERAEAFYRYNEMPDGAYADVLVVMDWLDLEAPAEEPLPCPFCGCEIIKTSCVTPNCYGYCYCEKCGYRTMECHNEAAAIAAHNRMARAVAKVDEMTNAKLYLGPDFAKIVEAEEKEANDATRT